MVGQAGDSAAVFRRRLRIFTPNERSGEDILSEALIDSLDANGVQASLANLWPEHLYSMMNSGRVPLGRTLFRMIMAERLALTRLEKCSRTDIAWILSFCGPCIEKPAAELKLKQRDIAYVFHVMDDWFSFNWLMEGTVRRCRLADLVVVPTPQLAERVAQYVPDAKIAVLEEGIDTRRIRSQALGKQPEKPVILWSGNPFNLVNIHGLSDTLREVNRQTPFKLRIICGERPSQSLFAGLDIEWKQFCHTSESKLMEGSLFGISPMPDTLHNQCKGAYKVKTYCASGLPVIASPVGFQEELVRSGGGVGLLPKSPSEWQESLLMLLNNRDLCAKMGQRARVYAEERFSLETVAPCWANAIKSHFGGATFSDQ